MTGEMNTEDNLYHVVIALKEIGKFDTFKEAFKCLYDGIQKGLEEGGPIQSYQMLESTCWISLQGIPTFWYACRDHAYELGLISCGKLTY